MTTLAQVNETLESQTPLLEESRDGINKLEDSFSKFFMGSLDDLEASREAMNRRAGGATSSTVIQQQQQQQDGDGSGLFSRIFEGLGQALSLAAVAGLFKALMKRGIFGLAALTLADDIGEYVKNMTGSDLLGEITEKGIAYASIGAMLFGKKGLIAGAILGGIKGFSNTIAEHIRNHKLAGEYSYVAGQATSSVLNIATGAGIGFMFAGPLGALVVGLGAAAVEAGTWIEQYQNNPEFRDQVNKITDKVGAIFDKITGDVAETVDLIFDDLVRTQKERMQIKTFNPNLYNELVENEKELAAAVSKFNRLSSTGAPVAQIEAARQEMMNIKQKRRGIEDRISAEETNMDIVSQQGEFGPGAANPYDITTSPVVKDMTEAKSGRDVKSVVERIALELGMNEATAARAAGDYAAAASGFSGRETENSKLRILASQLGVHISDLTEAIAKMNIKPSAVVNAPQTNNSSSSSMVQNNQVMNSGTTDPSDQIKAESSGN